MINSVRNYVLVALILSCPMSGFADTEYPYDWQGNKQVATKILVLNAKGAAQAFPCQIPPTEVGTIEALCFHVPLINLKNGRRVGTLTDAFSDIVVDNRYPDGLVATVTSTFEFSSSRNSSLTTRVIGNVQPFMAGSSPSMTHLTGFMPEVGENNVISGSGKFKDAKGTARESGAINLANFHGQPGDVIVFDLIWVIELEWERD